MPKSGSKSDGLFRQLQDLLPSSRLNFSYNVHNVWKAYDVPLHSGAKRSKGSAPGARNLAPCIQPV